MGGPDPTLPSEEQKQRARELGVPFSEEISAQALDLLIAADIIESVTFDQV